MAIDPSQLASAEAAQKKKEAEAPKKEALTESAQMEVISTEEKYRKGIASLHDIIAPSAMRVTPQYIELDGKFLRTIFVSAYPRYIGIGWLAPAINFSNQLDIAMYFYPVKAAVVLKQLQRRVGSLEAEISEDQEKSMPRDPVKETALRDIEKLRDDLTTGVEHFFQFALYVTTYANSLKELESVTDQVESLFASKLIYTRRSLYQSEQGFISALPFAKDELFITSNLNSSPCASSFPFISADLSSNEGILYGINRHNNSLVIFDRFSMPNGNMVVFATSGAGKSYTVKLEILRSLMFGADVIVIDPEKEYKHLCDAVGGTYVNVSLASESKINPFDLPRTKSKEIKVEDVVRSAVITLKGLLKLMIGVKDERGVPQFTPMEDSLLDRALLEAYAKHDIGPGVDLTNVTMPTLSDLEEVLAGMEGGLTLMERLSKYTKGTFGGLLNNSTNVKMANQLVVFSVRDLEDELRPVAIYTIVNYIWTVVRQETKRRILVIDEAWWLMQYEESAKFIFALVKRCRKYYLGVTTITQDVQDFLNNPYGRAIVTNCAMQMLLKQSVAAIDGVAKTFMLTEGERFLLLECGVGEGIFFAGAKHAAIRVVASYAEDQLITTDPRQLLEVEEAKKEFAEHLKEQQKGVKS